MSAFSRLQARAQGQAAKTGGAVGVASAPARIPPPLVAVLPPSGFADAWPDKPKEPVPIGIRLVASDDLRFARSEAARIACDLHPVDGDENNWRDAFNDTLMQLVVARATCQPHDVTRPFWDVPDENVKLALSSSGLAALWEAWDDLYRSSDALAPQASDDELGRLAELLADGSAWGRLDLAEAERTRRLLRHALATMEQASA